MSHQNYSDKTPVSHFDIDNLEEAEDLAHSQEDLISLDFLPSYQTFPSSTEQQLAYILLLIHTQAQSAISNRIPLNICLILDHSSSMKGEKLFQVKSAARQVVDQLTVADFFTLIAFNDRPTTVVSCQKVSSRENIKSMIDNIEGKGGTELASGLQAGIQEIRRAVSFTSLNYILLLTDGQTYGDADRCVQLGIEAARQNIVIYPMGIGTDWNEDLLETVAAKTGGSSEYIEAADQIVRVFMQKINQLRSTLTQNTTLTIRTRQGVQIKKVHKINPTISQLEQLENGVISSYNLGPMGRGSEYNVLIEMVLPPSPPGSYQIADINLAFSVLNNTGSRQEMTLPVGLNFNETIRGLNLNPEVREIIERISAFHLQERAWKEIENGDVVSGTKRLAAVSTRLLSLGEVDLAEQIQQEVKNLTTRGTSSNQGKKRIKYGTRGLTGDIAISELVQQTAVKKKKPQGETL